MGGSVRQCHAKKRYYTMLHCLVCSAIHCYDGTEGSNTNKKETANKRKKMKKKKTQTKK